MTLYKRFSVCLLALLLCSCTAAIRAPRVRANADRYFQAGEYDKAKIEYLKLLRLEPQNISALHRLGLIWIGQGAPLRAVPFLLRAREIAPQNMEARAALARAFLATGRSDEAGKEAQEVLQADARNAQAILTLADAARSGEEISRARARIAEIPDLPNRHLVLAILDLKEGKTVSAGDEVRKAIAGGAETARAHITLAYVALLGRDKAKAEAELSQASKLAPARSEESMSFPEFEAANGSGAKAEAVLQAMVEETPDYIPAWRLLAQIALTKNDYKKALAHLANVFNRDSDNPQGRLLEASIHLAAGESDAAFATLRRLDTVYPGNPLIKFQLGRAYAANNDSSKAAAAFEQALAAKSDYVEASVALAQINLRAGKLQAAVAPMEDLLKKHPELPQPRLILADCYRAVGRFDEAASLFREKLKLAPGSPGDHFVLGAILRQQGRNDEAGKEFEQVLELVPENWTALDQIVEIQIAQNRHDAAMQRVRQYIRKRGENDAGGHFLLGKIAAAKKDWVAAESELAKATGLAPDLTPAYAALVGVYTAQNKLAEAAAQQDSGLRRNPNDQRGLLTLGLLYEQMGDYRKARATYEKLLVLNPVAVPALNNLAYLWAERFGDPAKGEQFSEKARRVEPHNPFVADTLGWVLYRRGEYERAFGLLQESGETLGDAPEVQFHLGMAAYMMGQVEVARASLTRALQAQADFPGREEAKKYADRLSGKTANGAGLEERVTGAASSSDVVALVDLAAAYEARGEAARAAAICEQALQINPKLLSATIALARLYAGPLHDPDRALAIAKKARDLAPNDAAIAGAVGRIVCQTGNYSWARGLLQERLRQSRDDPAVLLDFATSSYALGLVDDARASLQTILDSHPGAAEAMPARLFLALTPREDAPENLPPPAEVDKILREQPDYAPALMAQAAFAARHGESKAAAEMYGRVLKQYPDCALAQKKLARLFLQEPGGIEAGYELAVKARKTLPADTELARTLAALSFKRNEFAYAARLFEEAAAKESLGPNELYYLGIAQWHDREVATAEKTLRKALSAGLNGAPAEEARRRLAEQARLAAPAAR